MTAAANRNSTRSAGAVEPGNDSPSSDALVSRITAVRLSLRPSEQRVASYVLGQPNRVAHMAIAELAEAVGVTDPTIARFCQALGFTGFKAFKVALAKSLATGVPYVHTDVSAQDSAADVVAKVFDRSIATLIAMRNQVDPKVFERAAEAVARARKVEFYGVGNSGVVAMDAQHKFFLLGMHTVAYNDPHWQVQSAALLTGEDVVVAISRTGRTRDMIQTCARQIGREDLVAWGAIPSGKEAPLVAGDSRRLREELGWSPRVSLEDGLRMTIDWWRTQRRDSRDAA